MTESLQPPDTLPTLSAVARVDGVSVPLIQATRPRGSRVRWVVAVVATLVVALVAGGLFFVAGAGATSVGPAYAPADALLYVDLRADLPGDQRQQLATIMSRFPGFADPATLEDKLDQAFDKLVRQATNGTFSYTANIKPWFGGQVAVAVGPGQAVLLVVSVSDTAGLPTQLDQTSQQLAQQLGGSLTTADHDGITVYTLSGATGVAGLDGASFAITGDAIVVARDAATVDAALDRHAGHSPSLAGVSAFHDAIAGLDGDRVGTFYLDGAALGTLLRSAAPAGSCVAAAQLAQLPTTVIGELQLKDGNLVARDRSVLPSGSAPAAGTSDLAGHVPAGAVLYAEAHDLGSLWRSAAGALEQNPCLSSVTSQLSTIEGLLGTKVPDALAWVGDAGLVVTAPGGQPEVGLVATTSDAATGQARLAQLLALVKLGAGQGLPTVTTTSTPYAGTSIVSVRVAATNPGMAPLTLDYAFKGNLFVAGIGQAFVQAALDTTSATSLASNGRYSGALGAAGGPTDSSVVYADLAALRGLAEARLPSGQKAAYSSDVQPYLLPLDRLISVSVDGQGSRTDTTVLFTK